MRLLGNFANERDAAHFCRFLFTKEIKCGYEPVKGKEPITYDVWIEREEDLGKASDYLEQYRKDPQALEFQDIPPLDFSPLPHEDQKSGRKWVIDEMAVFSAPKFLTWTKLIVLICVGIYLWNSFEQVSVAKKYGPLAIQYGFTDLQKDLIFDFPTAFVQVEEVLKKYATTEITKVEELPPEGKREFEKALHGPYWRGIYFAILDYPKETWGPMFEKIGKGEVWRLFTPVLLHGGIIHLLFNMLWLWVLGKQVEERMGVLRFFAFILLTGIVSNISQYLMSGPFFMGFSGIVAAMVGYIFIRQKIAPWEGYPLQRAIIYFLFFFILLMVLIQLLSFILTITGAAQFSINIANTAHIVGVLLGMALGYTKWFVRERA